MEQAAPEGGGLQKGGLFGLGTSFSASLLPTTPEPLRGALLDQREKLGSSNDTKNQTRRKKEEEALFLSTRGYKR